MVPGPEDGDKNYRPTTLASATRNTPFNQPNHPAGEMSLLTATSRDQRAAPAESDHQQPVVKFPSAQLTSTQAISLRPQLLLTTW